MKKIYRALCIFLPIFLFVCVPLFAWGNGLFYSGFSPDAGFDYIHVNPKLAGRIQGLASGDGKIAVYQEPWGQVHFYDLSGQYVCTLQLQRPGNGAGELKYHERFFWVRQPSGCVYAVSSDDLSVRYWTSEEAEKAPEIEEVFESADETGATTLVQARGSVWKESDEGKLMKIIDGSFLLWLMTGIYPFCIAGGCFLFLSLTVLSLRFKKKEQKML